MAAPHWSRTPRGVEPVRETCIYAHQNIFGQPLAHGVEHHLIHKKNGGLWEAIFFINHFGDRIFFRNHTIYIIVGSTIFQRYDNQKYVMSQLNIIKGREGE